MSDAKAGLFDASRILRVTPSLYHRGAHPVAFDPVGGLQTQVWRLAGALDAKGLTQTIWTGYLPGVARHARAFDRTRVRRMGIGTPSPLASRCANLAWFLGVAARRRRVRPSEHDLVHLHYNHSVWCRVLTLLLAGRGLPIVVSLSTELWVGTDASGPLPRLALGLARRVEHRALGTADAVIVLTPTGVPGGPSAPALPDGRVRVVPDAIDAERYAGEPPSSAVARFRSRHGVPANRPVVVFVGRLRGEKGWQDLPSLLVALDGLGGFLLVCGDGPDRAALDAELRATGRASSCRITGFVEPETVRIALQLADVLILPSRREAFGGVLLEAMAAGVPAVAYGLDAVRDVAGSPEAVRLVTPGDSAAFVASVTELLADPDARATLARRGRRRVRRYSLEDSAEAVAALYRELCAESADRRHGAARTTSLATLRRRATPLAALGRAHDILRTDGPVVLWFKLLGEIVYRRMNVYEWRAAGERVGTDDGLRALSFRAMRNDDLHGCLALRPGRSLETYRAWRNAGRRGFVAVAGHDIVGMVWAMRGRADAEYLHRTLPLDPDDHYLFELTVHPDRRRQGVATALLDVAASALRTTASQRFLLAVVPEQDWLVTTANPAARPMGRWGCVGIGRLRHGFRSPSRSADGGRGDSGCDPTREPRDGRSQDRTGNPSADSSRAPTREPPPHPFRELLDDAARDPIGAANCGSDRDSAEERVAGHGSAYWDDVARTVASNDRHYVDDTLAELRLRAYAALLERWATDRPAGQVLKTDVYEEFNGIDALMPLLPGPAADRVGIDLSPVIARGAKSNGCVPQARYVACDVRRLPFASGAFALIFSPSTLDHFADPADLDRSLVELRRVLRLDGRLVVTLDNRQNVTDPLLRLLGRLDLLPFYLGHSCTEGGLRKALGRTGYDVLDTTTIIQHPRLLGVALTTLANGLGWRWLEKGVRHALLAAERLQRSPLRRYTGCFVAALAVPRVEDARVQGGASSLRNDSTIPSAALADASRPRADSQDSTESPCSKPSS